MNDRMKMLGEEKISSLLWKLSLPAVIGMMTQALYNVVDTIFIGRGVGPMGIAGIAISFPIQLLVMAIAQMIGIGSASIISRSLGSKNKILAEKTLGNLLSLVIIVSAIVSVFGIIYIKQLLEIFGATKGILPYAQSYMYIILLGTFFKVFGMSMNSVVRAEGNAKVAMITMLFSALVNIVLDPVFIFGLKMGMAGAAIATVIAQITVFLWLGMYFLKGKSVLKLHIRFMKLDKPIVKETFSIGSSAFVRQSSGSLLAAILNHLLAFYGGNMAITVYGLVNRLLSFFFMPILGISQGFQPIAGFNYGAKNYNRTKKSIYLAILYSSLITISGFAVIQLFPQQLISVFTTDQQLIKSSVKAMRIITIMFPFVGFAVIVSTLFQSIGKALPAFILSLARQILFLIPLAFTLPTFMGLDGLWWSFPAAGLLTQLLSLIMFLSEIKKLKGKVDIENQTELADNRN